MWKKFQFAVLTVSVLIILVKFQLLGLTYCICVTRMRGVSHACALTVELYEIIAFKVIQILRLLTPSAKYRLEGVMELFSASLWEFTHLKNKSSTAHEWGKRMYYIQGVYSPSWFLFSIFSASIWWRLLIFYYYLLQSLGFLMSANL